MGIAILVIEVLIIIILEIIIYKKNEEIKALESIIWSYRGNENENENTDDCHVDHYILVPRVEVIGILRRIDLKSCSIQESTLFSLFLNSTESYKGYYMPVIEGIFKKIYNHVKKNPEKFSREMVDTVDSWQNDFEKRYGGHE